MYLDIFGDVVLRFHGKNTDTVQHVRKDYQPFEVDGESVDHIDIDVQFVEETSSEEESVHIRDPVAYDGQGVFFHPSGSWSVMRIDFDAIGNGTCRVTCDVNFNRYLMAKLVDHLIHLSLLKEGAAFCHSAAFEHEGDVVVCPAWRDVGKTNLLLSVLDDGADYIADDLCIVRRDGTVHSLPKRLNLLHYNFKEYPHLLNETSQEFQGLWDFVERARSGEFGLDDDEIATLTSQARMRVSPYEAFDLEPNVEPRPIDRLCLLRRVNPDDCPVTHAPVDGQELAHRMYATMEFEMSYLLLGYRAHKAQVGSVNEYLERAKQRHLEVYEEAIDSVSDLLKLNVPSQNHAKDVQREIETLIRT
ncbi:hypothetical protein [Halosimplex salinum]|uniref:hypothetical protein n=1 Tax=Halosimplex salinum TaxID=1710538 RepID=UPI000F479113|nr:hypothetical protein [Halosimplex salinum]